MSGVEAAGIALAVVPLIVSAIKSYKIAFHPIVVLCRYRKEFRDFKARLTVQKQLFENHCHVLLSKVHAEENLKDFASEGPRRTLESSTQVEQETEAKLALYLGNQYDACVSLISLIEDALLALQKHDLKDVYSEGFDEAHIQVSTLFSLPFPSYPCDGECLLSKSYLRLEPLPFGKGGAARNPSKTQVLFLEAATPRSCCWTGKAER